MSQTFLALGSDRAELPRLDNLVISSTYDVTLNLKDKQFGVFVYSAISISFDWFEIVGIYIFLN